jgi:hypothetical protein
VGEEFHRCRRQGEQGSRGAGEQWENLKGWVISASLQQAILMEEKTEINHQDSQLGKTLDKKGNISK